MKIGNGGNDSLSHANEEEIIVMLHKFMDLLRAA
jgi:hypothetical protein